MPTLQKIKSALNDFCNTCGACFPPREDEGICKEWKSCQAEQILLQGLFK